MGAKAHIQIRFDSSSAKGAGARLVIKRDPSSADPRCTLPGGTLSAVNTARDDVEDKGATAVAY
eukprot:7670296-Pyramimonas_sp.AAC.1